MVCAWKSAHPALQQWSKIHSTLEQRRSQLQKEAAALRVCLVEYEFRDLKVCAWIFAHPGLSNMSNRGVKCTQPWNSAAHNCKSSLRKCAFEYESSRVHTYGAHLRAGKHKIIFIVFLWIYLDCTIWKMSRHVQFHRVCAAHLAHPVYTALITSLSGANGCSLGFSRKLLIYSKTSFKMLGMFFQLSISIFVIYLKLATASGWLIA